MSRFARLKRLKLPVKLTSKYRPTLITSSGKRSLRVVVALALSALKEP
jgi:hypothetical protein